MAVQPTCRSGSRDGGAPAAHGQSSAGVNRIAHRDVLLLMTPTCTRAPEVTTRARRAAVTAVAAIALLASAGCGSAVTFGADSGQQATNADIQLVSGSAQTNGQSGDGGTPADSSPGPAAPARWVQLSSKQSPLGMIVTDVNGHTLYRFDEDQAKPPTSNCSGPCATTWPPVTIEPGGKVFLDGTDGRTVGSVKRSDGITQVTIGGWPVYRFAGDQLPGDTKGQGVKGTWFGVAPTGMKASTASRAGGINGSASGSSGSDGSDGSRSDGSGFGGSGAGDDSNSKPGKGSNSGADLTTGKGKNGTVIADSSGHTVYVNSQDSSSNSHCDSSAKGCDAFQPVRSKSHMHANIPGVADSDFGSIRRSNGSQQMTLNGHPLYTARGDRGRGDDDADGRDKQWYALGLDNDR